VWETNLAKSKRLSLEVKYAFQEELSSLDKKLIYFKGISITKALGQIGIEMN